MWWYRSVRVKSIFHDTRRFPCSGDFVRVQAGKGNETAIVHNAFKLPHRFEELCNRFLVLYLFGDEEAPARVEKLLCIRLRSFVVFVRNR